MVNPTRQSEDSVDPLDRALSPPPKETSEQRTQREAKEVEAKRESDWIDDQIKTEKRANSLKKEPVKVLMLGQAESGVSPLLPYFTCELTRSYSVLVLAFRQVNDDKRFHLGFTHHPASQ